MADETIFACIQIRPLPHDQKKAARLPYGVRRFLDQNAGGLMTGWWCNATTLHYGILRAAVVENGKVFATATAAQMLSGVVDLPVVTEFDAYVENHRMVLIEKPGYIPPVDWLTYPLSL